MWLKNRPVPPSPFNTVYTENLNMDDSLHVVHPRAAGLDVHKMAITATVRVARPGDTATTETREFQALPSGVAAMAGWLASEGVEAALMEGTGIYWETPFDALAGAGIRPTLVHARQVKQIKGRKTDVGDSVWLARLCQLGLASPSMVPDRHFRSLRNLCRYRRAMVNQRSQVRTRTQKVIDRAGIRIGGILTDIFGTNGRRILNGLCRGDGRQMILDDLSRHVRGKLEPLGDALTLTLGGSDRWILADLLRQFDDLTGRERQLALEIEDGLAPWRDQVRLLTTIPGISMPSACAILAETGPDLDAFPSVDHLASWAGLCPGNNESGGKRRSGRAVKGNRHLRATLAECAQAAARTKGCQFQSYHKSLMLRKGYKRAVIATAHKMLRVIHSVLRSGKPYHDPEADHEALMVRRNAPRWIRMLQEYGHMPEGDSGSPLPEAAH